MRRRLFMVASIVAMLICLAVCAMWARSYRVEDYCTRVDVLDTNRQVKRLTTFCSRMGGVAVCGDWTAFRERGAASHHGPTIEWIHDDDFVDGYPTVGPGDGKIGVLQRFWNRLGFYGSAGKEKHPARILVDHQYHLNDRKWFRVTVPYWFLAALFGALPVCATVTEIRRRRSRKSGCCRRCGYDLRASAGRCPECGTPLPRESRQQL